MATNTTVDKVAEAEESFRSSLRDVITVAEGLNERCESVMDLVGMAKLALENESMLHILIDFVTGQKK